MKNRKFEFVIIGSGNVAWHLAKKISEAKSCKLSVYNHQDTNQLQKFKTKFNCKVYPNLLDVDSMADFYFICVNDESISKVANKIIVSNPKAIMMHTSGSMPLSALGKRNKKLAVFYPIQTFSTNVKLNWANVPIVIDGNSAKVIESVKDLASLFSTKVIELKYLERLKLHLAAVLVNNFTNSLYVEAFKLLPNGNESNYDLLLPLMKQSVMKLEQVHPLLAQTGPAKRKDIVVIKKHLKLIENQDLLKQVYILLTELIMSQQKNIV
jgi:predicted short-subunit dehydrogenase-like oxidoreductase (DUF2520 family)